MHVCGLWQGALGRVRPAPEAAVRPQPQRHRAAGAAGATDVHRQFSRRTGAPGMLFASSRSSHVGRWHSRQMRKLCCASGCIAMLSELAHVFVVSPFVNVQPSPSPNQLTYQDGNRHALRPVWLRGRLTFAGRLWVRWRGRAVGSAHDRLLSTGAGCGRGGAARPPRLANGTGTSSRFRAYILSIAAEAMPRMSTQTTSTCTMRSSISNTLAFAALVYVRNPPCRDSVCASII